MSEYWDLRCRTCKVDCGFHWNHGVLHLTAIWEHRGAFVELGKLAGKIPGYHPLAIQVDFELTFLGPESGGGDFAEFAAAHRDHDVVVRSEHGRHGHECGEWLDGWHVCRAEPGHEDAHIPRHRSED